MNREKERGHQHQQGWIGKKWNDETGKGKPDALDLAIMIISALSVYQKDSKVRYVEVCDGCVEARGERPGQGHDDVATDRTETRLESQYGVSTDASRNRRTDN